MEPEETFCLNCGLSLLTTAEKSCQCDMKVAELTGGYIPITCDEEQQHEDGDL